MPHQNKLKHINFVKYLLFYIIYIIYNFFFCQSLDVEMKYEHRLSLMFFFIGVQLNQELDS